MTTASLTGSTPEFAHLNFLAEKVNNSLLQYCDKDWNYSRISLQVWPIENIVGPYVLWIDSIQTQTKKGQEELKTSKAEIAWGQHHSSELGILEIISLRLNKALIEATTDESWNYDRPVVRIRAKEDLQRQAITHAFWYDILEVAGQDFENR